MVDRPEGRLSALRAQEDRYDGRLVKWPWLSVRATLLRPGTERSPEKGRREGSGFSIFNFRLAIEGASPRPSPPSDGGEG